MKKIKIFLTSLVFVLAISGVVAAKAIEKKRQVYSTAYYQKANGTWQGISSGFIFDDTNVTIQAAIPDQAGTLRLLYASQSTTTPVRFIYP